MTNLDREEKTFWLKKLSVHEADLLGRDILQNADTITLKFHD